MDRYEGANCGRCGLGVLRRAGGPVPAEVNPGAQLVIVGDMPSSDECTAQQPFVGEIGNEVLFPLASHDFKRKQAHWIHAIACRASQDDLSQLRKQITRENKRRSSGGRELLLDPLDACRPRLLNRLQALAVPNVITLGKGIYGITQYYGQDERGKGRSPGIATIRGAPVQGDLRLNGTFAFIDNPTGPREEDSLRLNIFPTVSPHLVAHTRRWTKVFRHDLAFALRWFRGDAQWVEPLRTVNPSPAALRAFLLGRNEPFWLVDVETDSYEPISANLRCIGFATENEVYLVALRRLDRSPVYAESEEAEIREIIRTFLGDPTRMKAGHNLGTYDWIVCRREFGVEIAPLIDSLPLHKSVDSELPHSLGFVATMFTAIPRAWKVDHTAIKPKCDEDLWHYCGNDCVINARIIPPLVKAVEARGQQNAAWVDHRMQYVCAQMHLIGMYCDEAKRREFDADRFHKVVHAEQACRETSGLPKLNPGSNQQIGDILYRQWRFPIEKTTASGDPSTGDEVLRALLAKKLKPHQREFLLNLRAYRAYKKERGTYIAKIKPYTEIIAVDNVYAEDSTESVEDDGDWMVSQKIPRFVPGRKGITLADGRFHPGYNILTVSGRLNSSAPINCFDAKTEVLTRNGWVFLPSLKTEDEVAQWWPDGRIDFTIPTAHQRGVHRGPMVTLKNRHVDLRVTGDHRCSLRRPDDTLCVLSAKDYQGGYKQIHAGNYVGGPGVEMSDALLRLVIAAQACGRFVGGQLEFTLAGGRTCERLVDLLHELKLDYCEEPYMDGLCYQIRSCDTLKRIQDEKEFESWVLALSRAQLDLFCEEIWHWSGENNYWSSWEPSADWVQIALALSGVRTRKRVYVGQFVEVPDFKIDQTRRDFSWTTSIRKSIEEVEEEVFCVSVPSSYILVRRGGRICVTGQSQNFPKKLREMVIPAPGNVYIYCDMDQLELRLIASIANASNYLEIFWNAYKRQQAGLRVDKLNPRYDPHSGTAAMIFNKDWDNASTGKKEYLREFSKRLQYAIGYGAGLETVHEIIVSTEYSVNELIYADKSQRETRAAADKWMTANPEIVRWWFDSVEQARVQHFLADLILGRRRDFLDGIEKSKNEIKNFVPQATGSAAVNLATINLVSGPLPFYKWGPHTGLVNQCHDALLFEVPESHGAWALREVEAAMNQTFPSIQIPLTAKAKIIRKWSEG